MKKIRFDVTSGIAALVLIILLFQPPFNADFLGNSVTDRVPTNVDILQSIIDGDFDSLEGSFQDLESFAGRLQLMLFSLCLAILLFAVGTFGVSIVGSVGAGFAIIYAILCVTLVQDFNDSLGFLSNFGGISFGFAGWAALLVGAIYLLVVHVVLRFAHK